MAKKKSTSFYLSDEAKQTLKELADQDNRSQANMLEVIIDAYAKIRRLPGPITPFAGDHIKPKKKKP